VPAAAAEADPGATADAAGVDVKKFVSDPAEAGVDVAVDAAELADGNKELPELADDAGDAGGSCTVTIN
jgi:hypothetical protein